MNTNVVISTLFAQYAVAKRVLFPDNGQLEIHCPTGLISMKMTFEIFKVLKIFVRCPFLSFARRSGGFDMCFQGRNDKSSIKRDVTLLVIKRCKENFFAGMGAKGNDDDL